MKYLAILCLFLVNCVDPILPDADGNVIGRIVRKVQFSDRWANGNIRYALVLSNGDISRQRAEAEHYCYVSSEEHAKRNVGEIYTCSYKQ